MDTRQTTKGCNIGVDCHFSSSYISRKAAICTFNDGWIYRWMKVIIAAAMESSKKIKLEHVVENTIALLFLCS